MKMRHARRNEPEGGMIVTIATVDGWHVCLIAAVWSVLFIITMPVDLFNIVKDFVIF